MSIKELFGHAIGVVKFGDIAKFYNYLTKRDHTLKGDITFEGGVDVTAATLTGLPPAYATEIAAIDAGLAFGDKYVDSDGVVQTVTKIKQTITLPAGLTNMFGFLIDLDTLASKDVLDVLPGYAGTLSSIDNGSALAFDSTNPPVFNTLTTFVNGRGYIATPTASFSIDIYGPPLSESYHTNLTAGNNVVVHNSDNALAASASAWVGLTVTSVVTYVNSVLSSNPATWVKGQGYLVTTSNGPQAAIGSPSTLLPIERNYKVYSALLTQSSTSAPTVTVIENTLGTVTPAYEGVGSYTLGTSALFTANKTVIYSPYDRTAANGTLAGYVRTSVASTNAVRVLSANTSNVDTNGILSAHPIEIRVYD